MDAIGILANKVMREAAIVLAKMQGAKELDLDKACAAMKARGKLELLDYLEEYEKDPDMPEAILMGKLQNIVLGIAQAGYAAGGEK